MREDLLDHRLLEDRRNDLQLQAAALIHPTGCDRRARHKILMQRGGMRRVPAPAEALCADIDRFGLRAAIWARPGNAGGWNN